MKKLFVWLRIRKDKNAAKPIHTMQSSANAMRIKKDGVYKLHA